MVRSFNVGAASVFDHFYVLGISALEQYSVLWMWICWLTSGQYAQAWINFRRSSRNMYETDVAGFLSYCIWRSSLFRSAVIDIAANVEFVGGQEMYWCLPEAFKDWTLRGKRLGDKQSTETNWIFANISLQCILKLGSIPSFITFDSWSCSNRGPISSPTIWLMMASTSTRALLSRKLKSPNQKIWSNLVVTSAVIINLKLVFT